MSSPRLSELVAFARELEVTANRDYVRPFHLPSLAQGLARISHLLGN